MEASKELKKYIDKINQMVKILSDTTDSVNDKTKEFITVLTAVNSGIITSNEQIQRALDGIANGNFESESSLKSLLKTLDLTSDNAEKIVAEWRKFKLLSNDQLKSTIEYKFIVEQLNGKILDLVENTEHVAEAHSDVATQLADQVDLVSSLISKFKNFNTELLISNNNINWSSSLEDNLSNLEKMQNSLKESVFDPPELFNKDDVDSFASNLQKIFKSMGSGNDKIKFDINSPEIDINNALADTVDYFNTVKQNIEEEFKLRDTKLKHYIAMESGLKYNAHMTELENIDTETKLSKSGYIESNKLIEDKLSLIKDISSKLLLINNLNSTEQQDLNKQLNKLSLSEQSLLMQYKHSNEILDVYKHLVDIDSERINLFNKSNDKLNKMADSLDGFAYDFNQITNILPYSIQRLLGLNTLSNSIVDSLKKSATSYAAVFAETQNSAKATTAYISTFAGSLKSAAGPVGLLVAGFAAIYLSVNSLTNKIQELTTNIGISKSQAIDLNKSMKDLISSSTNRLTTEEDIIEIQKAQIEKYGQLLDLSKQSSVELIKVATNASNAFGISVQEAFDALSQFKNLGATDELANQLIADIGYMSELAGISPKVITKDLLESGKELSLYFSGYPKEAAKAIIQIHRMGMSLKQAGQIADKMLDIEGFMIDMSELSAMSFGKLDLSKAFDLRMSGDISGMTNEIMNQIGSLSEFGQLSEFTQRKLAGTLGMEVDDLRKSLKLRDMQNSLSKDQLSILQDNLSTIGDINNLSAEQMKSKADELSATKRLGVAFDKIKATLSKAFLPIIETFADTLASSTGIIDTIGLAFKGLGLIIKGLSPIIKGILLPFQVIGNVLEYIVEKISSLFEPTKSFSDGIEGVNTKLSLIPNSLELIGIGIGSIFGTKYLGKLLKLDKVINPILDKINPFKSLKDKIKDSNFGKGLFDKINPVTKLKNIITNSSSTEKMTNTITNSTESSNVNTKTLQESASKFSKIGDIFSSVIDKIKSGFRTLKDFIVGISETIKGVLINLGEGIGNFIKSIISGLGEGLSKFQPKALIGVAAFAALAGSIWILGKAMQQFSSIKWEDMAKAGVAVIGLTAVMSLLGSVTPLILTGSIALAAASGAVWLFGKALNSMGKGLSVLEPIVTAFVGGISNIATIAFEGINKLMATLSNLNPQQLLLIGPALISISTGLAALTASSAFSSLGSLFSGNPFKNLEKLVEIVNPIKVLSDSINQLVDNLSKLPNAVSSLDISKTLKTVDMSYESIVSPKILPANNNPNLINQPILQKQESKYDSSVVTNNSSVLPSNSSNSKLERKLDELLQAFVYFANRPTFAVINEPEIKKINDKIKPYNNK